MAPSNSPSTSTPPLHTLHVLRRAVPNRIFAVLYICAISSLFYHHTLTLLNSTTTTTFVSLFLRLSMLLSDAILALMWATCTSFRMRPVRRRTFPENLVSMLDGAGGEYPGLDVFICTADPYKEPPMSAENTALSVMAHEYPKDKISVYISDDGGSKLTLFAFMEAARFARHWLPFCRERRLVERSPEAYFNSSNFCPSSEAENMKVSLSHLLDI